MPASLIRRVAGALLVSSRAVRDLTTLTAAAQLPVVTGRRIAVTSVAGDAGTSTVAALLGSVFAARRADAVLAADADAAGGGLAARLGVPVGAGLAGIAPRLLAARGGDLRGLRSLLPRTGTGLWVLPAAAAKAEPGGEMDAVGTVRLAREVTRALSRLFAVCVTDCGRGLAAPAVAELLAEAHAVVVVAPRDPAVLGATRAALDRIAGTAPSSRRVVVVVTGRGGAPRGHLLAPGWHRAEIRQAFAPYQVPVVVLPYDEHLASGGVLAPGRVAEAVLVETVRLAGLALIRATAR